MTGQRVWTTTWSARALSVVVSSVVVILSISEPTVYVVAAWAFAAVMLSAVFTSRLTLRDGTVTARQFSRSRSVRLDEVERVGPGFLLCTGLVIRTRDGGAIRTLVSGELMRLDFGTSRAERLCHELMTLADLARSAPDDVASFCPPRRSPLSRLRGALTVTLLLAGWLAASGLAHWWAHREDIAWALEEPGSRGPNYLLIASLVYWGAVSCVVMVRAANAEVRDSIKGHVARR